MEKISQEKTALIKGIWTRTSGDRFASINPSNGKAIWEGNSASREDVRRAVESGKEAFESWSGLHLSERQKYLTEFAKLLMEHKKDLAAVISDEVGKPRWDALTEVQSAINKVDISVAAYNDRCRALSAGAALTRFRAHGVVGVFGTFNFPLHMANVHIVPALLAGNTVVLKPSELAPLTAQKTVELWIQAGIPGGVINLVHGARETGEMLVSDPEIAGIFFTGSVSTGVAINKAVAGEIQKIVTLELGGNNPLVVHDVKDCRAAAHIAIQSAYITSGQRCTCARRLIVTNNKNGDNFLAELIRQIRLIRVGAVDEVPEPFMGPVISIEAVEKLLKTQEEWVGEGGIALVAMKQLFPKTAFVTPGLIDVTRIRGRKDVEVFGPLLQCIRVETLEDAIEEANNTRYGLSASIFCDRKEDYELFLRRIRAGVVNWNQQTTGASSGVPFGGIGLSGNHRPTAYFAADYCSYPVSSVEITSITLPEVLPSGISLG